MQVDTEYLRKHYSSLSDAALLDVERAELTEAAQKCYDDELAERNLSAPAEDTDEESGHDPEMIADSEPDWADEAACACTFTSSRGKNSAPDAAHARDVLQAAGIECYLASRRMEEEEGPAYEMRVMVPGNLNLLAQGILDKEIFNLEVEAEWKTYFETLSDEELRDADTEHLFCGLLDRIERVTRAYNEEKSRREPDRP